jgi:hypothetical protein
MKKYTKRRKSIRTRHTHGGTYATSTLQDDYMIEELEELSNKPCSYFTKTKQEELLKRLELNTIFNKASWIKVL